MKKMQLFFTALAIFICATAFSATISGNSAMLAIVNPASWGLDSAITSIVSAAVVFIVGWFTKPPRKNKKND